MIAYALLQHLRLKEAEGEISDPAGEEPAQRGENAAEQARAEATSRTASSADAAGSQTAPLPALLQTPPLLRCPRCSHCFRGESPPNVAKQCYVPC